MRETSLQHLSSIVHWVYLIRYIFFSFRCLKQLKINITGQIMVSQFHITICIQNTYFSQTLFIDILQREVLFKFIYIYFFLYFWWNISDFLYVKRNKWLHSPKTCLSHGKTISPFRLMYNLIGDGRPTIDRLSCKNRAIFAFYCFIK